MSAAMAFGPTPRARASLAKTGFQPSNPAPVLPQGAASAEPHMVMSAAASKAALSNRLSTVEALRASLSRATRSAEPLFYRSSNSPSRDSSIASFRGLAMSVVRPEAGRPEGSPFGLHFAPCVRHQPAKLLGLNAKCLHLSLRVAALEGEHLLDIFRFGQVACQSEGAFGVLLGEADGPFLNGLEATHLRVKATHLCVRR